MEQKWPAEFPSKSRPFSRGALGSNGLENVLVPPSCGNLFQLQQPADFDLLGRSVSKRLATPRRQPAA